MNWLNLFLDFHISELKMLRLTESVDAF